nr:DPP IV N-terminal domain-containing protein [Seonamhaeicola sp. S2-3]
MKQILILFTLVLLVNHASFSQESNTKTPSPNYRLASKFSPKNISKIVHSTEVFPHWLEKGNRFWYQYKTSEGSNYYIVDPEKKTRNKLFDNAKMAKWLSEITKDAYDAKHLPRFNFKFVKNETAIRFKITSKEKVEVEDEEKNARKKAPRMQNKVYHLEYKLGGNGLTIINSKKSNKKYVSWASIAPDSTIVLFSKNFNLYWMDKENYLKALKNENDPTIIENQWTKDGVEHFSYGGSSGIKKDKRYRISGYWSHDSKKFVFQRTDKRHIKDLWVINSISNKRPTLETYKYHMAGEQEYPKQYIDIFDTRTKAITPVKLDTTVQQNISIYQYIYQKNDTIKHKPSLLISKKGKIYFSTISRDFKRLDVHVADINSGEVTTLIKEHSNVSLENYWEPIHLFNNENEILFWSERDGWGIIIYMTRKEI